MQNINPTKNRNRRANFYLLITGFPVVLTGCVSVASVALMSQLPLFGDLTVFVMGILAVLAAIALVVGGLSVYRGFTLAHDNEMAYQVGEFIKTFLGDDPRYTFIRNVSRRRLGYIDAVLIGPPGALVFRIVDYAGTWRCERAEWKVMNPKRNNRWRPAPSNPSRECARDVYALRKYLARNKQTTQIPVYGVVVFHNPDTVLQAAGPVVPVSHTHRLYEVMSRDYLTEERINSPRIRATVDAIVDQ